MIQYNGRPVAGFAVGGVANLGSSFGIDAGGQLFYAAADKPTITGGGATDTTVGGVDKDYADIPFFNAINGAAIVEAE